MTTYLTPTGRPSVAAPLIHPVRYDYRYHLAALHRTPANSPIAGVGLEPTTPAL
jgi:hypothetical protein